MNWNRWIQSATAVVALGTVSGTGVLAAAELSLGRVAAHETLPVSVPLTLAAEGGENALACSVSFDASRLRLQQAVLGSGAGGASLLVNLSQAGAGRVGLALALPPTESFAAGEWELVDLRFQALDGTGSVELRFADAPVVRGVSDVAGNVLSAGYVNGSVEVAALLPPTFTVVPTSQTVPEGANAIFLAAADSPAPLTWQWFHDATPLPGESGPRLVIRNLAATDAGIYRVAVSAAPGRVSAHEATLTMAADLREGLVGQWDFDEEDLLAGVGQDLEFRGDTGSFTSFLATEIGGQTAVVMAFPRASQAQGYRLFPATGGNAGGARINRYTLIIDLLHPAAAGGQWKALLQTDPANGGDAELFVTPDNGLWVRGEGTAGSGLVTPNVWHRLAFAVNADAGSVAAFLDGLLVHRFAFPGALDGEYSLGPEVLLFTENNLQTSVGSVNSIQLYDRLLSESEIAELGGPSAAGLPRSRQDVIPPTLLVSPVSEVVRDGEAVTLTAVARGTPPLTYRWRHNGADVPGAVAARLHLPAVSEAGVGEYVVLVENPAGTVASVPATVSLTAEERRLTVGTVEIPRGQAADVPVVLRALGGEAAVSWSVQFDPGQLRFARVTGAGGGTAFAKQTELGDGRVGIAFALSPGQVLASGERTVAKLRFEALGEGGNASLEIAGTPLPLELVDLAGNPRQVTGVGGAVSILSAPRITSQPDSTAGAPGGTVTFSVEMAGTEPFSFRWRFNGTALPGATSATLHIENLESADAGEYSVEVSNRVGSVVSEPARLVIGRLLRVGNGGGFSKERVEVPLMLFALGDENSLGASVRFDAGWIELLEVVPGLQAPQASLLFNSETAGRVGFMVALPAGEVFTPGWHEVARLALRTTGPVSRAPLAFASEPVPVEVSDATAEPLPTTTMDGSLTTMSRPVDVEQLPDLLPLGLNAPDIAQLGQAVRIQWRVRNLGRQAAVAPWQEVLYLAPTPDSPQLQLIALITVSADLPPGEEITRSQTLVLPPSAAGANTVLVEVDVQNNVAERLEDNNRATSAGPVTLVGPDLLASDLTAPAQGEQGTAITVAWTVANHGTSATLADWRDRLILKPLPGTLADGLELLDLPPARWPLAVSEQYRRQSTVTLPLSRLFPPGYYQLVVVTDAGNAQAELDETNNQAQTALSLTLVPPPDLVLASVTAPGEIPAGQPVWVTWTLRNDGVSDAPGPWTDALQLVDSPGGPPVIELARVPFTGVIEPGESVTRSNLVVLAPSLAGPRFLRAVADVDDHLPESNDTTNNSRTAAAASLVTAPNLVVESLIVPPAAVAGDAVEVSWTVRNSGNAPVTLPWTDRLGFNGPGGGKVLLERRVEDHVPLAPGGSYSRTVSVPLPLLTQADAGSHTLFVTTDVRLDVAEAAETDNTRESAPVAISLPPMPDLSVLAVEAPADALSGSEVELVWTVANLGEVSAPAPWQETLLLSDDAEPGNDLELAVVEVEELLAAGAVVNRTNRVRVPLSHAGSFRFVAVTDSAGDLVEKDEGNNLAIADVPTLVPAKLTLDLAALNVSEDADPPALRGRLFRSGPVATPLQVTLTSSDPGELQALDRVTLPAGAAAVDVSFGIVADGVVDGSQAVTLTASAPGMLDALALVTVQDVDRLALVLELDSGSLLEGESVGGRIVLPDPGPADLEVLIQSEDLGLLVPEAVLIPAGEGMATFAISAIDDDILAPGRTAEVVVTAEGYVHGWQPLDLIDNDDPGLMLEVLPPIFSEGAGGLAARGRVTRANVTDRYLTVELRVEDATEARVLPQVVIPGGRDSAEFIFGAVDDDLADGDQAVVMRAYVAGLDAPEPLAEAVPATFTVTDDDGPALHLALGSALVREGLTPAFTAVVSRNTGVASSLPVTLACSEPSEATVPAGVVIPAGAPSVTFPINTVADGVVDGSQAVTLTAGAAGHSTASAVFTVSDAELPDLVVSELVVPAGGLSRGIFTVRYRITNQGFATVSTKPIQRVLLSPDALLGPNDLVLDETPLEGALGPGQSSERQLSLFLPATVGDWWVFVVADVDHVVGETLENNNTAASPAPVRVAPAYTATVQTDLDVAPAGTIIPLYGTAVRPGGEPAIGELVNLHVITRGMRRTLSALTDLNGGFTANFQPFPTEGGAYTIGAAHPGVASAPVQDSFSLLALRLTPDYARQVILPGGVAVSDFELANTSDRTLTGITGKSGAVEGLDVQIVAPTELAAGASAPVQVISTVPLPRDAAGRFLVLFESSEGAVAEATIDYLVELPVPRLAATPHILRGGMVRDRQTYVEFEVLNTGGAETGPLNISLPEAPWLKTATPSPMPSLQPGESAVVTLLLQPDASLPLQEFDGRLAVSNPDVGVPVSFVFRHVSDATGDLRVMVTDENTYYGDGANLAGAQVNLRDAVSGESVFADVTDETGTLDLTGLREGTYNLEVTAPRHDDWLQTIRIEPGRLTDTTVFLRTQLLRYSWKVEEIDLQERATIKLETIYETGLPSPVVTVDPPLINLTGVKGDEVQVELKFTNRGSIAARDVVMNYEDGGYWSVHPLVEEIGVIPPQSSVTVPVIFRRIPPAQVALHGVGAAGGSRSSDCRPPSLGVDWHLICGPFGVSYWVPAPVIDLGRCDGDDDDEDEEGHPGTTYITVPLSPPGSTTWQQTTSTLRIPSGSGGNNRAPGGSGTGGDGLIRVLLGSRQPTTYEQENECACDPASFNDKCVTGEAGYKAQLEGYAEEVVNAALSSLAYTRLLGVEVDVKGTGKLCVCCATQGDEGIVGMKAEGTMSASISAKIWIGPSLHWKQSVDIAGLSGAEAEFFVGAGAEVAATGFATLKAGTDCLLQNPQASFEAGVSSTIFIGAKGSASVTGQLPGGPRVNASAEGTLGFQTGVTARFKQATGTNAPPSRFNVCQDAGVFSGTVKGGYQNPDTGRYVTFAIGVEKEVFKADCPGEQAYFAGAPGGTDAEVVARWMGYSSPAALAAAVAPNADLSTLSEHPSGPDLSRALMSALPDPAGAEIGSTVFSSDAPFPAASAGRVTYNAETLSTDEAREREVLARLNHPRQLATTHDGGVCAQVRLVLERDAVVTRKAIGATLEVINESDDTPIENLGVTINIYDAAGNLANDRFLILDPELTRLSLMDAPTTDAFILNGKPLQLAPATTGAARWVILPKDEAAPDEPQDYFVGGILAYTAADVPGSAELVPGQVTVHPNARLHLKYFHQRDVFADDPFTDELEPSIPFLLGVMIENRGNGLARDLTITSGQPKIVENVKGLLIDFNIIATEVEGRQLTPSLTADFGDLAPHSTAIGRWYLKSTLQGLFLDYQATLEHEDRFGERGASVFEGVEIHELIHQVEALGPYDDARPDFLVNDEPDDEDLADTVHLSDATSAPVTVVRAASPDGAPSSNDLEIELTAPMPAGFAYLWVPDPAEGDFRLTGVRRSDGRVLEVGVNAWTTDRTFIGQSRPPRLEHRLHLFDHDSTGQYTLIYAHDERVPDTTAPVSRVAALPPTSPTQIPLAWSGSDDALGSGIAGFDLFVSTDGGPFIRWLQNMRNTAAIYPGAAGRRYAFYAVARDLAGNVEPAPLAPEATTLTTGNSTPQITSAPSASVDEGEPVAVQIEAVDADLPGDTLTFSLVAGPPGAQIHPTTGRLTWPTGENDGPRTHQITVRVTDNGDPALSADRTLSVTVREVNQPVTLAAPASVPPAPEGELWTLALTATDPDLPRQSLRYRIDGAVPSGLVINLVSGQLTWIPGEALGGSSVEFDVTVSDGGTPEFTDTQHFTVQVLDRNSPPTLEPIADHEVWEGDLLSLTARAADTDLPVDTLVFSLDPGAPDGAAIAPDTGAFTWIPGEAQAPGVHPISVRVTDNGVPARDSSRSFQVTTIPLKPGLNRPERFANGDVSFRFKGVAGRTYVLQASIDLRTWIDLRAFLAEEAILTLIDQTSATFPWRFFRAAEAGP